MDARAGRGDRIRTCGIFIERLFFNTCMYGCPCGCPELSVVCQGVRKIVI